MILQGESYEFGTVFQTVAFFPVCNPETSSRVTLATLGTVFQTDFVALLDVACWMLLVGSLLFGYRLLDIACWLVAFWLVAFWQYWQSTKQQNHKTTRQQKKRVSQPSYLMELSSLKSKTIHAERSISIMVPRAKPG